MPTEELGASAFRKYDMEAWMPGRGTWGEISSTSNCTDYQSRRLSIRYRPKYQQQFDHHTLFCHTLNGTAIAVPRIIISILETFQKPDGSVEIPAVLRKWLPGEPSHLFPAAPSTSSKSSSKASSKTSSKKEYQKGLMKSPLY
jgi:seryl-tRNA synthetase